MNKSMFVGLIGFGLILGSAVAQDDKTAPAKAEKAAGKDAKAAPAPSGKELKTQASYSIGLQVGQNLARSFKAQSIDLEPAEVLKGLADGLNGAKPALSEAQIKACMDAFEKELVGKQQEMAAKADAEAKVAGEKNKKEGDAFLAANKAKPGVKTLPSGLQYKVITEGKGASPKLTDSVKAHYSGKLLDGTEFDSSYKRGEPATFQVQGVIKGWTEALQLMKVGSKWQLVIPANLAYGERGRPSIPPNSVLVFEVELLGIE